MRAIITTLLELAGLLTAIAAVFVALLPISLAVALAAVGVLLVASSAAVEWLGSR